MPAKRHTKHPNVNAQIYDGEFEAYFDCARCARAKYYTDPPEETDECAFRHGGGDCSYGPAQRDALIALRGRIDEKLKGYEGDAP